MPSAFRSLGNFNFGVWSAGAAVANVGTWMQRIAQDWLVLSVLTQRDATAVGIVTAHQFTPQVILLPWTGYVTDHWDRRKLLLATQGAMGLLALGLGVLTVSGLDQIWHVYLFALLLGCATAFDGTVRQVFVADMVGEVDLSNAVALNSMSFNTARLVGPALAGLLIHAVGTGMVFFINAESYVAVLGSLWLIRQDDLSPRILGGAGSGLSGGIRYVIGRPDLKALLAMLMLFGTFGLNFPIFISTMAITTFHSDARGFGLLTFAMGVGSVLGAVGAARRARPSIPLIALGAGLFGVAYAAAAVAPTYALFGLALFLVGAASQTVTTSATTLVQMSTEPALRGRAMALLMAIALGGQPLGAPLVGWIANTAGPRWAVGVGSAAGIATALVGLWYVAATRAAQGSIRNRTSR